MPSTYRSITPRVVADLTPGDPTVAPNTFVRDPGLAGFAILIGRSRSSYIVEGRAGRTGRNVRVTLGTVGRLELDAARTQAKEAIGRLAAGRDPVKELRTERAAGRLTRLTFADALAELEASGRVKASTLHDYRRSIAALGWLDRKLVHVKSDVRKAYEERRDRATSAGRIFRSLRSVWNFARAQHPTLPPCPTSELKAVRKKWATAPRRQRVIPDTLLPLWRKQVTALDRKDVHDLILLLHYTGLRIGEARALAAEHVDLPAGSFVVTEPKNGRPLALPIVRQVRPILHRRIAAVGKVGPLFPFGDVRKSHVSVNAAPWSYHDLRRQYVTAAHRIGIDDLIARRLTNHAAPDDDAHAGYVILSADALRSHAQKIADNLDKLGKRKTRK